MIVLLKPASLVKSSLNDVKDQAPMISDAPSEAESLSAMAHAFLTTSSLANQHRAEIGLVVSMPEKK